MPASEITNFNIAVSNVLNLYDSRSQAKRDSGNVPVEYSVLHRHCSNHSLLCGPILGNHRVRNRVRVGACGYGLSRREIYCDIGRKIWTPTRSVVVRIKTFIQPLANCFEIENYPNDSRRDREDKLFRNRYRVSVCPLHSHITKSILA